MCEGCFVTPDKCPFEGLTSAPALYVTFPRAGFGALKRKPAARQALAVCSIVTGLLTSGATLETRDAWPQMLLVLEEEGTSMFSWLTTCPPEEATSRRMQQAAVFLAYMHLMHASQKLPLPFA